MINLFTGRIVVIRILMLMAMAALIGIGLATIYAAGNPDPTEAIGKVSVPPTAWKKQLIFAIAGLLALIAVNTIPYRLLGPASYWLYPAMLLLLAFLLSDRIIDTGLVPNKDARRWIKVLPGYDLKIQPSEFCKIAYILALAWYLRFRQNYRHFKGLIGPFALTLLAMVLIILEPDLGTVLLLMPILFAMLYVAGAKVRHLLLILFLAAACSPFLLRPYQRMRITGVLLQSEWIVQKATQHPKLAKILAGSTANLNSWKKDDGYQLEHSKRAIGSGGLKGYGFRKGPYISKSEFYGLPEMHNDLIFSIIAHQWGFLGCLVVVALYATILICGMEIATYNTDPFARLVTVGILAMFAVQIFVNISMTLGIMPITGLTLPLVSYGGSSLLVSMMAIGLLNNIGRCRPFTVAGKGLERAPDSHQPTAM
jgi:rod shape determining protein RodA